MEFAGNLFKMKTINNNPVDYYLNLGNNEIHLNKLLGKNIRLSYQNEINCIHCGRKTSKSFFQGYCYPCFTTVPQADESVIKPELNQAHLGISKDMEWSKKNDLIDHYVYLSYTSDIKVGVTRHTQVPTRWIDQGAEYAIRFAKTPYRQLAGEIEVALKPYLKDKTNWRKMLAGNCESTPDLLAFKDEYANYLPHELTDFIDDDDSIIQISYPIIEFPQKIKSLTLDKNPIISAKLLGIKGQYLLLDENRVFNIRKHNGYKVIFESE